MHNYLDFEKPIAELEGKIEELRHLSSDGEMNIADEVGKLQTKVDKLLTTTYEKLSPWQKTQVARHHDRPHAMDYINALIDDFTPLAGDRQFAEDPAVVGGMGSPAGAVVGALGMGIIGELATLVVDPNYRAGVAFLAIALVLLIRPHGLFGRREIKK